ncbi:MAG: tyrosine recombinase XerC [Bacteroidaceae bacterium]|nr:tyrosine recombinase XerC [Bacteroidaceae bacterium]
MYIQQFVEYLRLERNYSERTVASYLEDLVLFEQFLKGRDSALTLLTADADLVRAWVMQMMDAGYKSTSVNRKLSTLRTFYRYLRLRGVVDSSPVSGVKGPKNKKPLPQFVRASEMDELLDHVDLGEGFLGARNRAVLDMLYETGIRLAELVGLNDQDVDLAVCQIKVTGKRDKQRIIPFGRELKATLQDYLELREEWLSQRKQQDMERETAGRDMETASQDRETAGLVWRRGASGEQEAERPFFYGTKGGRIPRHQVYLLVHDSLGKVSTVKKKSPHVLRHTFATSMLNGGAELGAVKELLGHDSLATTQVYTHTTFEELKDVYRKAHPRK